MRVGILSESEADEAGIKVLVEAVLKRRIDLVQPYRMRSRGWSAVFSQLPAVFKSMHFNSDAVGLVVVVDSDETPVHRAGHDAAEKCNPACRICELNGKIAKLTSEVSPGNDRTILRSAIGLAVPAIEGWYRCGLDVHCTESRFARESREKLRILRQELKVDVYSTKMPPIRIMRERAIESANRLAKDLPALERNFPIGFGTLAMNLRRW
jgi:hypothetical protein